MLISREFNQAINVQIGREMEASLQYLSIAAYFEGRYLKKLAGLFFKQAEEENEHAMKFVKYILEAGGNLEIPALAAPKATFESAEDAVGLSLKWENDVTKYIYELVEITLKEKDYIGREFLSWFVSEQLEEVSSMDNLLGVLKQAGEKNLIMVEGYLSH
ncbi:MAG: ftnA [Chloroflexi bacterium]|nr:MAG: ftnA [Chloroflexota bacterium]MBA4376435.1 ferritin [Anaerolinea sp.]